MISKKEHASNPLLGQSIDKEEPYLIFVFLFLHDCNLRPRNFTLQCA